jgi:vacuolar-type H+-ATPase subunit H
MASGSSLGEALCRVNIFCEGHPDTAAQWPISSSITFPILPTTTLSGQTSIQDHSALITSPPELRLRNAFPAPQNQDTCQQAEQSASQAIQQASQQASQSVQQASQQLSQSAAQATRSASQAIQQAQQSASQSIADSQRSVSSAIQSASFAIASVQSSAAAAISSANAQMQSAQISASAAQVRLPHYDMVVKRMNQERQWD